MQRLIAAIAVCAVLVGGVALARGEVPCAVLAAQPTCQVALRPGPSEDATALIEVEDIPAYPASGELRLSTVAVQDDLGFREWLRAGLATNIDAVPRQQIYPAGIDPEVVADQHAASMAESQLVATVAALRELGYDVEGEGARVAALADDVATDAFEPGDVITAVDGESVRDSRGVVDAVQAHAPGDRVAFEVTDGTDGARTVEVTLGASPQQPGDAYVGVLLTTALDLPVDVTIDAGAIGGPSAGLMFALSIIEVLDDEDLTQGRVIAGTGTLDPDGVVGAVGGVQQKVAGAANGDGDDPASVFLVPPANLDDARSATVDRDVLLVPVATLDDALGALDALRGGDAPPDAQLLAAAR